MNIRRLSKSDLQILIVASPSRKEREAAKAELRRRLWRNLEKEATLRGEATVTLYTRP